MLREALCADVRSCASYCMKQKQQCTNVKLISTGLSQSLRTFKYPLLGHAAAVALPNEARIRHTFLKAILIVSKR
jgi:hypothetical protein